jgi:uncharacterized protein (DUF608 family)
VISLKDILQTFYVYNGYDEAYIRCDFCNEELKLNNERIQEYNVWSIFMAAMKHKCPKFSGKI